MDRERLAKVAHEALENHKAISDIKYQKVPFEALLPLEKARLAIMISHVIDGGLTDLVIRVKHYEILNRQYNENYQAFEKAKETSHKSMAGVTQALYQLGLSREEAWKEILTTIGIK